MPAHRLHYHCTVDGCNAEHEAKGLCKAHYHQGYYLERRGPLRMKMSECSVTGCHRKYYSSGGCDGHRGVARKYGLSILQLDAMYLANPLCNICDREMAPGKAHIDHDHSCCPGDTSCGDCIRGILCQQCNHAIGLLGDDPVRIERAASYIKAIR